MRFLTILLASGFSLGALAYPTPGYFMMDFDVTEGEGDHVPSIENHVTGSASKRNSDAFVQLDFDITQGIADLLPALQDYVLNQRDNPEVSLQNEKMYYVATVSLGTPPQAMRVLLDTGSSDLWVMSNQNPKCSSYGGSLDCSQYGTFDSSKSSTFDDKNVTFSIKYSDNTFAKGAWAQDTMSLGKNIEIQNATFAVAQNANSSIGIFGVAYPALEAISTKYPNLPMLLKKNGVIDTQAYSLYLNLPDASTGSILFGAYDEAKFKGSLQELTILPSSNGEYKYLQAKLDYIYVSLKDLSSSASFVSSSSSVLSSKSSVESSSFSVENSSSSVEKLRSSVESFSSTATSIASTSLVSSSSIIASSTISSVARSRPIASSHTGEVNISKGSDSKSNSKSGISPSKVSDSDTGAQTPSSVVQSMGVSEATDGGSNSTSTSITDTLIVDPRVTDGNSDSTTRIIDTLIVDPIVTDGDSESTSTKITDTLIVDPTSEDITHFKTTIDDDSRSTYYTTTEITVTSVGEDSTVTTTITPRTTQSTNTEYEARTTIELPVSFTTRYTTSFATSFATTFKTAFATSYYASHWTSLYGTSYETTYSTFYSTTTYTTFATSYEASYVTSYETSLATSKFTSTSTSLSSSTSKSTLDEILRPFWTTISKIFKSKPNDKREVSDENENQESALITRDDSLTPAKYIDYGKSIIFDSGASYTYLDKTTIENIVIALDSKARFDSSSSSWKINCDLKSPGNSIVFNFSGKDIALPVSQLVNTNNGACYLNILEGPTAILGNNFFRSAYTVFNLDAKTISVAQVVYSDKSSIKTI